VLATLLVTMNVPTEPQERAAGRPAAAPAPTLTARQADTIASAIRDGIARGDYAPGQRLVEVELGDRYGASRAAVRDALRLLASDGLVDMQHHRAARVRVISHEQAIELAEVRIAIESLIAAKAAERVDRDGMQELRWIGSEMRKAVQAFDPLGYSHLNEDLHVAISRIAQHHTASAIHERIRLQMVRFQLHMSLKPGRPLSTLVDHERIIDAICDRDPEAAEAAMRAHLREVLDALRVWGAELTRPR
jgi:DNA-binding GntR family transcriptional regulator